MFWWNWWSEIYSEKFQKLLATELFFVKTCILRMVAAIGVTMIILMIISKKYSLYFPNDNSQDSRKPKHHRISE